MTDPLVMARAVYPLTIDCTQPLAALIAAGKYDAVNENITATNFPVIGDPALAVAGTGTLEEEVLLVHFGRAIEDDEVTRELGEELEDLPIEHLLAFGAKYPELQREFAIVARGSSWVGPDRRRRVPCFVSRDRERDLILVLIGGRWHEDFRFLVRRKKTESCGPRTL